MSEPAIGEVNNCSHNAMDDGDVREGLGSLNRWSQSTTSSSISPNSVNHYRQESAPKLYAADNYVSHNKVLSLEADPQARPQPQTINGSDRDRRSTKHHTSQTSVTLGDAETAVQHRPDTTILPETSASMTGLISLQSDTVFADSTSMQNNSRIQRRSLEMDPFRQTAADYSGLDSFQPPSQHGKRRQGPSQKAMLSKALQKANTAVLLDNAANFEGAMDAYTDACQLLQLVMLRSNGGDDEKLKLQEIRDTYMIRVNELQRMDLSFRNIGSKALPERPLSQESYDEYLHTVQEDNHSFAGEQPGFLQGDSSGTRDAKPEGSRKLVQPHIPPRRQSLLPSALEDSFLNPTLYTIKSQAEVSRSPTMEQSFGHRHKPSGATPTSLDGSITEEDNFHNNPQFSGLPNLSVQARNPHESTSWLDTIDESGASSSPSVHSEASSVYLRRRRNSRLSHGTEAEFDAALDAAVEAAYDEGFEPASEPEGQNEKDDVFANARRNVEIAKQKVREAEREAKVAMTRGLELRRVQEKEKLTDFNDPGLDYLDEEAEEEERLLEEMTRGYVMDDFEFDLQSKSALPRQPNSSSFLGNVWESPTTFNPLTTGGILPPLVEDETLPEQSMNRHAERDVFSVSTKPGSIPIHVPGVRARRMSGQNTVELKIQTSSRPTSGSMDPALLEHPQTSDPRTARPPTPVEKDGALTSVIAHPTSDADIAPSKIHQTMRNVSIGTVDEDMPPNLNLAREITAVEEDHANVTSRMLSLSRPPIGKVPSAPDNLGRTQQGTLPFRARNVSVPNPDMCTDSPGTPSSNAFPSLEPQRGVTAAAVNALPTPTAANFSSSGLQSDGLYLFDSYIHSPTSPGSPNPLAPDSPLPLEPCPESFLLRPFWLLRCIYQTITHPRGGYLTTKLFIPQDAWRVKNVKIKAVEEKVSNCDLLTAALLKLSKVDTYDADAVLEEMQAFESVLDQVQMTLSKKLGSEVGVQGAMPVFKAAQALDEATAVDPVPSKTLNGPGKSYLSSWRKLRSKNSGFGAAQIPSSKETSKDNLTISSLPMTSTSESQPHKRNIAQVQFTGPNANYMSALARLCDAAQVLDQIAQQVEDPGLKHSSQTLVGLELSTRHAAEFFGFYICRFALNDIGIMLDKFIKRGSEWVLL